MIQYFSIILTNEKESLEKTQNSFKPLLETLGPHKSVLLTNVEQIFLITSTYCEKKKRLVEKLTDLISSLDTYEKSMRHIYNENLKAFDKIIEKVLIVDFQFTKTKAEYYKIAKEVKKIEVEKIEPFSGTLGAKIPEEEVYIKMKSKLVSYEQFYKYELLKYNKLMEEQNEKYSSLILCINNNEQSRIYFVKSVIDKYTSYINEVEKETKTFKNETIEKFTSEICSKDKDDGATQLNNYLLPSSKRIDSENFVSFSDLTKEKFDESALNYVLLTDNLIPLTEENENNLINDVLNELLNEAEIKNELIAQLLEQFQAPNSDIKKKFLNALLDRKKLSSIIFTNIINLQHLANIITNISVEIDTVFNPKFDLNFKVIFLAERIYYENKVDNSKAYLSALLSKNKYYRNKYFWRDFIELKLAKKLEDDIDRLKNVQVGDTKKTSVFKRLGFALGINDEERKKSLVFKSRICKLIKNYDTLDISKISLLDKIATTEMSGIIQESIPNFANFKFPSEEALDMIAELAEEYKIPKDYINFYVTYYNISSYTIRKTLPNEINSSVRRTIKPRTLKGDGVYKIMIFALNYLDKSDYVNLMVLSKKCHEKISKKIYKIVLKSEKMDVKTRLQIWENILHIKEIKKKYNYKELLIQAEKETKQPEIRMDVLRTFIGTGEDMECVKQKLFNILQTIVLCNGDVKYCQGMNYIAEFIYELTLDEEETFYIFLGIFLYTEYPLIFAKDLLRLKIFFYVFKRVISLFEPELYSYFNSNCVDVHFFVPPWFITLFLSARQFNKEKELPIVLIRIIDNFLISGWKALIKVGIEALHSYEIELMNLKYEDMLQFLINDMLKNDFFTTKNLEKIEKCFSDNKIQKKLIKKIETEFMQEARMKENEEKKE